MATELDIEMVRTALVGRTIVDFTMTADNNRWTPAKAGDAEIHLDNGTVLQLGAGFCCTVDAT